MERKSGLLIVKHNVEVAHRLFETGGKCENIHGHSMWVRLSLRGWINAIGLLETADGIELEFGAVKKEFRGHLDTTYDHRLLLSKNDPFAGAIHKSIVDDDGDSKYGLYVSTHLPGLNTMPDNPTTENIALWISQWALSEFKTPGSVSVDETSVNTVTMEFSPIEYNFAS
jgi:6-pyruvoyltetrahydropterin/6-carboxytetrahydropterin synthase